MLEHLRTHLSLYAVILFWVVATVVGGPLIYGLLPFSVFMFRGRELWPHILFGFLIILILSDMDPAFFAMRKIKSAKYLYMIAISAIFLLETDRFSPVSTVFKTFMPFLVFAFFPLVQSSNAIEGFAKTTSYVLLYLVVPNYVLYNFRRQGWEFVRNFIFFIMVVLIASYGMRYLYPGWVMIAGRYRAFFGNPNGLGIFCFVVFMLVSIVIKINKDVFTFKEKILIFGLIIFFLIKCGSRTSVTATFMFLVFSRFFSLSPFIGFIGFILFAFGAEMVSSNLPMIIDALGLHKFFRVETIEDGSGRYFAWSFAWEQINKGGFFLFGGGFGNDEWVMRHNYAFLRSMGHHGGVHNSYLTMWFNTGIVGVLIFLRSFFLTFFKANKRVPIAFAVMFSTMFSVLYESWLTGSLNPFTIILVTIMTLCTEDEVVEWRSYQAERSEEIEPEGTASMVPVIT